MLVAGGLVAIAGGVLLFLAQSQARALMVDARGFLPVSDEATVAKAQTANTLHLAGLGGLGAGVAAAAVGAVLLMLPPDSPSAVTLVPLASGLVVGWGGRLP